MDDKFIIGEQADPRLELKRLLDYNEFIYTEQEDGFRLIFSDMGLKWETEFVCTEEEVLIFSVYPFSVRNQADAEEFCAMVNRQVVFGAMLWDSASGRLVFRTGADLFDAYSAYEQIGRQLEYNANVITYFWSQAADAAQRSDAVESTKETKETK